MLKQTCFQRLRRSPIDEKAMMNIEQRIERSPAEQTCLAEIVGAGHKVLAHISILNSSYKPLDVHRHLCLCRFERDKDALEGHTLWVRDKISHFSSRSTVL